MQKLGTNTIRIYNINPAGDHDLCASIFNAAGIYMLLDVNSPLPNEALDRSEPWTTYNSIYLTRIFSVVEAFKGYPNLLGFFAGNEVINDEDTAKIAPPYVRAVQRDLKDYIAKHATRAIPVGYSAADNEGIRTPTWAYLQCAIDGSTDDTSKADFYGLNSYEWCGTSDFHTSGYSTFIEQFANTTIPVFFSEYGCNNIQPRVFTEVQAIYGPNMTIMSGGLVYEYAEEPNNYGLVTINSDGSAKLRTDYNNLQTQYNKIDVATLETKVPAPVAGSNNLTVCDAKAVLALGDSSFYANFTLPVLPPGGAALISKGVSGANVGKLVSVTVTTVKQAVTDTSGAKITGLAITVLNDDAVNTPAGSTTSASATSASSASASPTKKSGGEITAKANSIIAIVAAVLMVAVYSM
jgi:1,3-beta-glucanosyltransferase GAS3